jgi:glyoxylase-like metal-dependent hydrolase (beta-lactamase superfamily II)
MIALLSLLACQPSLTFHTWSSGADGFDTTSTWIDDGTEVTVFDAQFTPDIAAALLAEIEATTSSPVTRIVATHPNPDKFNGASVFQDSGASFIASDATAAAMPGVHDYKKAWFVGAGMFTEDSYPALPVPDQTFSGTLDLGNGISLTELAHGGVSSTQTVGIADDNLIVGDLGFPGVHAWLEGGIVDGTASPDLDAWRAALAELPDLAGGDVYPGRGDVTAVGKTVDDGIWYLDVAEAEVDAYVGALADPMSALTGDDANTHYANITAQIAEAAPARELEYLVTYGVYGLAFSMVE